VNQRRRRLGFGPAAAFYATSRLCCRSTMPNPTSPPLACSLDKTLPAAARPLYMLCLRPSSARIGARPTKRSAHDLSRVKVRVQTSFDGCYSNCNPLPLIFGCFMLARCLMKFQCETSVHGEPLPCCWPPPGRSVPSPSHTRGKLDETMHHHQCKIRTLYSSSLALLICVQTVCTACVIQLCVFLLSVLLLMVSSGKICKHCRSGLIPHS
jgi:hypothetical protein